MRSPIVLNYPIARTGRSADQPDAVCRKWISQPRLRILEQNPIAPAKPMTAQAFPRLRGFTLMELLAVVMILGVMSAIALPMIGRRDDLKTASAAREITADLLYAQSQSIATARPHCVIFDMTRGFYCLADGPRAEDVLTHPARLTPWRVAAGEGPLAGVRLHTVSFDGQCAIAFDALGAPYSYSQSTHKMSPLGVGTICLEAGEVRTTLTIHASSGQITSQ